MWASWIGVIALAATLAQLGYWLGIFARLACYRAPEPSLQAGPDRGVSVIICAKNEAANLRKNLSHFLNQNYRSFEILVVNDGSTDGTAEVLLDFQTKYSNLRVIELKGETPPGKKAALLTGILAAQYDLLLLSDADCKPSSSNWIRLMQIGIPQQFQIGLGFSPYLRARGWLNAFIRFEAIFTAVQYLSFALVGLPYMGVGRNLIYTKGIFLHKGSFFTKHMDLASGDDDLFVNEVANRANTRIIIDPGSFVFSLPKRSWRGYYIQKSRHLSAGRRYRPRHQVLLGGLSLSHVLHYSGIIACIAAGRWDWALILYSVRMGVVWILYWSIFHKLRAKDLAPWIPLLDLGLVLFYFLFAPALITTGNQQSWK